MSTTLTQLQDMVFGYLNEDSDSVVGEIGSNNANSPTQTTLTTFTQLINIGAALLCKSGIALYDTGTYSWPSGTTNALMTDFTMGTGGVLWCPLQVIWNGQPLNKMGDAYKNLNYPPGAASGTPNFYVPTGQYSVQLLPTPSATQTVSIEGLITPPILVNGSDVLYGISDDQANYIAYYAAYQIAEKNIESPNLQLKVPVWKMEFAAAQQRLWTQLLQVSPQIARAYFSPPSSLDQVSETSPQ